MFIVLKLEWLIRCVIVVVSFIILFVCFILLIFIVLINNVFLVWFSNVFNSNGCSWFVYRLLRILVIRKCRNDLYFSVCMGYLVICLRNCLVVCLVKVSFSRCGDCVDGVRVNLL